MTHTMHYDQGYFEQNLGHSESVSYDNSLEKGVLEWNCEHHVTASITSLSSLCHYQHHITVSITSLTASRSCHNVIASIMSLSASCHCQHHTIASVTLSASIIASITSLLASHHCSRRM